MAIKADKIFKFFLYASGVVLTLLVLFTFYSLLCNSLPSIKKFGISFLIGKEWNPVSEDFGILPFIIGTFATSIIALFLSLPFSISIALLLGIYIRSNTVNKLLSYTTDLLAGIPSVIYGFWGLFFLVPIIREMEIKLGITPYGVGIITASLILAIMIIPYTSSIAREIIKMVPQDLIEAGLSLGATRYDVIRKVILPYARSGIFAGIFLSFGRAFGETMAVTMVIGNSNFIPKTIFSPANTMASLIANEFTEATKDIHLSALIQIGFWLFLFTFAINLIANKIINKFEIGEKYEP